MTGDVKFILTNRLNRDCFENLFVVMRSKGGHRDNPDPLEFGMAFRQVMVDELLLAGTGTNYKDDLDNFKLNFARSKQNETSVSTSLLSSTDIEFEESAQLINLAKSSRLKDVF
ncbi:hypothetical protein RRG08_049860 [Elysia crispata]|uniref:Uncharacterized protein n=1 Tax=Elysia crispata TaxID=231223 RepID=A0AAE1DM11_9GAST|nr:hypothetical protein RRG08_049860 [Elysia crispata]